MKIVAIVPRTGPLAGQRIEFCPGVNIVRGANGTGKTLLLEYASLLGHVAIMKGSAAGGEADLEMFVRLGDADHIFLSRLADEAHLATLGETLTSFKKALAYRNISFENLRSVAPPTGDIKLSFYCKLDRLKAALADEQEIEGIGVHGNESEILIVRALNLWSRPLERDGVWSVTPRYVQSVASRDLSHSSPGPVFYVNTDMYDFGTGLDIRESPKDLRDNITPLLLDRLQLIRCGLEKYTGDQNLSDTCEVGEPHILVCQVDLKEAWGRIFGADHPFAAAEVQRISPRAPHPKTKIISSTAAEFSSPTKKEFKWQFDIAGRGADDFVSSGENHAFFLLAVLYGLVSAKGACMLFDEPELHLPFRAGSLLIEEILKRVLETRSQAIIVTHLPQLHRSFVADQSAAWTIPDEDFAYKGMRMIHLDRTRHGIKLRYDLDAINEVARSSHLDVLKLIEGLRLKDEVPIVPTLHELRSWLLIRDPFEEPSPESNSDN